MPDQTGLGCVGGVFVVGYSVWFFVGAYYGPHTDDQYFRHIPCKMKDPPAEVEITTRGLPADCVPTKKQSLRFVNRLTAYPVTLCIGQRGVCATGHYSPMAGGRVTLKPGESRKLSFPTGSFWGLPYDRKYPVTVLPAPGTSFSNTDMTVRSNDESQPAVP
ncbi:hypothetical protein [Actinomadura rubrisoli]|uniref:Uncharacterized protein n=1 Tax=Actinomadura rubrisoli TaxID=2530368 RepID=A0A4R5B7J6_9ACTN|nr:hypothetical protein [Actinomadura rubrisoli]TDD81053.1 hypothetical protein E1298_24760 [Actinomadura rubrisoli]